MGNANTQMNRSMPVGPTTKSLRGEATSGAHGTSSSIRESGRTATCSPSASPGRSGSRLSRLQQVVFLARDVQMISMSRLVTFTNMHSRKPDIIRYPESAKRLIKKGMFNEVKSVMSEKEFDKHFTPPYNPWEQRFCLAPGGDFFKPIRCRDLKQLYSFLQ